MEGDSGFCEPDKTTLSTVLFKGWEKTPTHCHAYKAIVLSYKIRILKYIETTAVNILKAALISTSSI